MVNKHYPKKVRAKALSMYLQGKSVVEISKYFGANRMTIQNWKTKDNWAKCDEKAIEKTKQLIVLDIAQMRSKQFGLCDEGIDVFATKTLKNPKYEPTSGEAVGFMRHQLTLAGLPTDITEHTGEDERLTAKSLYESFNRIHGRSETRKVTKPPAKEKGRKSSG